MQRCVMRVLVVCLTSAVSAFASAERVSLPFTESFEGEPVVSLKFSDFNEPVDPARLGLFGAPPGWRVHEGRLDFFDHTNFGDVGTALVLAELTGPSESFRVSVTVDVHAFEYNNSRVGVLAGGDNASWNAP